MNLEGVENTTVEEIQTPFTETGKCNDEVTLTFDDGQVLYVSQNFLTLASPVFEAMFCGEFKENQTKNVNVIGKKYDDFLKFLMCIHPGSATTISRSNVLQVIPIADEYQVTRILHQSKEFLKVWMDKELNTAKNGNCIEDFVIPARNCLYILKTVSMLNYRDLMSLGIETVSKFGHRLYYGSYSPDTISPVDLQEKIIHHGKYTTVYQIISECRDVFKGLPADVKYEVLAHKLALYPDNALKVAKITELPPAGTLRFWSGKR